MLFVQQIIENGLAVIIHSRLQYQVGISRDNIQRIVLNAVYALHDRFDTLFSAQWLRAVEVVITAQYMSGFFL